MLHSQTVASHLDAINAGDYISCKPAATNGMRPEMWIAWTVTGIVVPFLWAAGLTVLGYPQPELLLARGCFILGGAILLGMTAMWMWRAWPLNRQQIGLAIGLVVLAIAAPTAALIWMGKQATAQTGTPPNVIQGPGSAFSYGQSGGITAGTVYVGPQARNLNSPWGEPLKQQMLRDLPRDKEITVESVLGDSESADLAVQIHAFLKANGFKMKEDGISQGVFNPPAHGLGFNRANSTFVVGSK